MTPIATLDIVAISSSGEERSVALRLERPEPTPYGSWACAATLDGLHERLRPIEGEDSLQALCLALRLLGTLLRGFVAAGGRLELETGEAFPLDAYFPG